MVPGRLRRSSMHMIEFGSSNVPKVLARVGLQQPGLLVQIVNADDPILTIERTKSLGARGTSATWGACADRRCFLVVLGGSWWFLVVLGCSWWFLVLCCLAESQCIPTVCFQDAHDIDETSRIHKKLRNCWFLVVPGCFLWFLVVPGRSCRSSMHMIEF